MRSSSRSNTAVGGMKPAIAQQLPKLRPSSQNFWQFILQNSQKFIDTDIGLRVIRYLLSSTLKSKSNNSVLVVFIVQRCVFFPCRALKYWLAIYWNEVNNHFVKDHATA